MTQFQQDCAEIEERLNKQIYNLRDKLFSDRTYFEREMKNFIQKQMELFREETNIKVSENQTLVAQMKTELTNTLSTFKSTLGEVQNSQKQLRLTFQTHTSEQENIEKNILDIEKAV